MLEANSRDPEKKSTSSYHQRTMSTLEQFVRSKALKWELIIPFSAVDDVFVRKDLLKSKYDFVDFASVEKHPNWCKHYSECNCGKPAA